MNTAKLSLRQLLAIQGAAYDDEIFLMAKYQVLHGLPGCLREKNRLMGRLKNRRSIQRRVSLLLDPSQSVVEVVPVLTFKFLTL